MFENPHYGKNVSFFENENTVTNEAEISAYRKSLYNLRFLVVHVSDFANNMPNYVNHFFYELLDVERCYEIRNTSQWM